MLDSVGPEEVSVRVDGPWIEYPSTDTFDFVRRVREMEKADTGGDGNDGSGDGSGDGEGGMDSSLTRRYLDSTKREDHFNFVCESSGTPIVLSECGTWFNVSC